MVILRDTDYGILRSEIVIDFKNKHYDGKIRKAIADVRFKFGLQVWEDFFRNEQQEIYHKVSWTLAHCEQLIKEANDVINQNNKIDFFSESSIKLRGRYVSASKNMMELYVSIGIKGRGTAMRMIIPKDWLKGWVNDIKKDFLKN